jgi:hypothetical protein
MRVIYMSKAIEKLFQKRAAIEAEILAAENAEKAKPRVEKLVLRILQKYPQVFSTDLKILEQKLEGFFANFAANPE